MLMCSECPYETEAEEGIYFCPNCGTVLVYKIIVKGRKSGNSTVLTAPKQAIDRQYKQQVLKTGSILYTPLEGGNLDE